MNRWVLAGWLAACPAVWGWGVEGHNLVARLAAARLSPKASAAIAEILGPNATLVSISSWADQVRNQRKESGPWHYVDIPINKPHLVSISSWADQVRNQRKESGPWHYVDIPINKPHLDMKRDCAEGNCVLVKIPEFERVLADRNAPPEKRKEALMFIVHFVGDMHQPLHCSDNKDKGGNDVKLEFLGRPTNLHSLWDSGILARMGSEDVLFADLNQELSPKRAKSLAKGDVKKWAEQSHRQGQVVVYGKLPAAQAGKATPLNEAYQEQAVPVVREQLERAGARLAKVLNATLNR
jgi:hypothetical protein